jgi:hypothetical protein
VVCKDVDILATTWIKENRFCANLCHTSICAASTVGHHI